MSKRRDIPESDSNLFRKTVGKVKRIENDQVTYPRKKSSTTPTNRWRHTQTDYDTCHHPSPGSDMGTADKLYFKRPGLQQKIMEKLRKGRFKIENQIDLHGMTVAVAEKSLNSFLESCLQSNYRCIRIIHGKGTGSVNRKPIIKNRVNDWLRMNRNILAFCSAKTNDGGTGAVYVLLRTME